MGNSNHVNNPWRQTLDAVVEHLISKRWRQELFGNLCERTPKLSPRERFLDAVDVVRFSLVSGTRRELRISPLFEPCLTGLMMTIFGSFAALSGDPPLGLVGTDYLDFFQGGICGLAVSYWTVLLATQYGRGLQRPLTISIGAPVKPISPVAKAERPIWLAAAFVVLLVIETCLVLLNVFPGGLQSRTMGDSAFAIMVGTLAIGTVHRGIPLWD